MKLEVAQRVYWSAVDPDLEVEMRPEAVAGAADVPDRLPLRDRLPHARGDARLVGVRRREPAAVVDRYEVPVALHPARVHDPPGGCGVDRRARGGGDVDS